MDLLDTQEFQPRTVDKVERLLDVLEEIQRHPHLSGKLAMHGGTAINLFMLDVPRLSVDIDISYIGALGRANMLAERPDIERAIIEVGDALGYNVTFGEGGHAGITFALRYNGDWGPDQVKIDCIYMNRSPLFEPRLCTTTLRPEAQILMFCDYELAGGKVKAFFDRIKVRDLYDVSNLNQLFASLDSEEERLFHQTALYYASLSARFPQSFEGRALRFSDKEADFADQLVPMLRSNNRQISLQKLIEDGEAFIERFVLPRNESECEYLTRFATGEYCPELIFDSNSMTQAAKESPEALWKLQNIKKLASQE